MGDGMEGVMWMVWKELEGMVDMEGMDRIRCKDTNFL